MTDRINMRERMGTTIAWPETPGDRPECRKWRNEFDRDKRPSQDTGPPPQMQHDPSDLCRSVRVFIAKKDL